ncbi:MAG: glycosyltransferase family 4 protein [Acidobacteria bacterium]|nr:glycosyltransferase family 4 protein [Acidobacteriota bacterium]
MNILYVATDQVVPGTTGGSVHVQAVAEGLAALGHTVHAAAEASRQGFPRSSKVQWNEIGPLLGLRQFRWARARRIETLARRMGAHVIIERYYNFGGEGMIAARRTGARAVLEVNAPIVDYPRSPKRTLDLLTIVQPMRRWREWQCSVADLLITPSASIVPEPARPRVLELEWGADTDAFRPDAAGAVPFARGPDDIIAVFVGAFRPWHGASTFVRAIADLRRRGNVQIKAVLIGNGPELPRARAEAHGVSGITFTGPLAHDRIPPALASADIGVAPFEAAAHPPLAIEFFWSPLKVFEYMAAGLPVVAPDLARLRKIVRHGEEGWLYDRAKPDALAAALLEASDPAERARRGAAARSRVVSEFSWAVHCARLDEALKRLL